MRPTIALTAPLVVLALVASSFACSGGKSAGGEPTAAGAADSGVQGHDGGVDGGVGVAEDGGTIDGTVLPLLDGGDAAVAGDDAGDGGVGAACEWGGAPGVCMSVTACAALADHSSFANECPGPASIECCLTTPSTTLNPPVPAGWELMQQAQVTTAMTDWAEDILNAPATYPMFATTTQTFGTLLVLARVEWHPPDFQNSVVHRGVTLYEQAD